MSLKDHVLNCSAEPCVMCSGAIHWAQLSRVVFSVSQQMLQQKSKGKSKPSASSLINIGNWLTEVVGPVLPDEGLAVFEGYTFTSKADEYEKRKLQ
jgi:tRNA(Arg) A34 adenosine deaminase TadA